MKTLVITGGTDGIGRVLARTYLDRGDTVVVIGRNAAKADPRAVFVHADLSVLAETRKALEAVKADHPVVDALVLCARHYHSARHVTSEGVEYTLAHFYLSRHLLCHGLAPELGAAEQPIIMNVAGPGADESLVRWNDLEFSRGYDGGAALGQGGVLNDLMGIAHAAAHPRTSYVLVHPGMTSTGLAGDYDARDAAHIRSMKRVGRSVAESSAPIIALLDAPPAAPLSAFVEGSPIELSLGTAAAARLTEITRRYLRPRGRGR